jgi:hypothetical protein
VRCRSQHCWGLSPLKLSCFLVRASRHVGTSCAAVTAYGTMFMPAEWPAEGQGQRCQRAPAVQQHPGAHASQCRD